MAKKVQVKWLGKRQFVGIDNTKHSVVMSSADEENNIGMSPSQLLLVGLGGCTAYDVVDILQKKRERITGLEVTVTGDQDKDPPWTYRKIHILYAFTGKKLNEKAIKDAIVLSEEKYCSVSATVRCSAEITSEYIIREDE